MSFILPLPNQIPSICQTFLHWAITTCPPPPHLTTTIIPLVTHLHPLDTYHIPIPLIGHYTPILTIDPKGYNVYVIHVNKISYLPILEHCTTRTTSIPFVVQNTSIPYADKSWIIHKNIAQNLNVDSPFDCLESRTFMPTTHNILSSSNRGSR